MAVVSDFDATCQHLDATCQLGQNADERTQRVLQEARMAKDALAQESERVIKFETVKKSLEAEIREMVS